MDPEKLDASESNLRLQALALSAYTMERLKKRDP
jgi:hypothetical protein